MKPLITFIALTVFAAAGCEANNTAQREAKREQDRTAMQLADAQRERDDLQGQVEKLKVALDSAVQKQSSSEAQATRLDQELAAARAGQVNADQLKAQLSTLQSQVADSTARNKELQTQVDALKAQLQQATAGVAPATQPMRDMNK